MSNINKNVNPWNRHAGILSNNMPSVPGKTDSISMSLFRQMYPGKIRVGGKNATGEMKFPRVADNPSNGAILFEFATGPNELWYGGD